jgi:cohesin complex subunit SA-1/2
MHNSGVLYDDIALIENIQLWVTTMSSSFLRPFRHTATVVALAITTSLCKVAKEQTESTAKSLRILEGEKKKKGTNKGRLATFQQQIDQGNERRELCENTIRDFFDTVFVHRYRDVDSKIRTDCVEALGQWVIILPNIFLEGAYLRYLGWMLSDISAPTRHEAVNQLEKILKNTEKIAGIREFVERFRARIVEMAARDSETGVRASAVDLLDLFREAGMLEPDDIDVIGKLIFDTEPRVRKAVVGFFAENIKDLYESKIEELGGEEALEDIFALGAKDPETPHSEWITLKCLAEVLLSYDSEESEEPSQIQGAADSDTLKASGVESRFFLAAQALYDKIPAVSDWDVLAGYLLFDHSVNVDPKSKTADIQRSLRESFKLDEKEEVVLLEILDASVKLNLAQSDDHDKSKKKTSKAEAKELQESTARRLAVIIPRLLSKFGANPKTTAAVLRLEQELNLSVFQALRMEDTAYPELLHEIGVQFKGHSDQRVLSEASAALLHARQYEELEDTTEESMQTLWDDTVEDMRTRFQASSKAAGLTARGDLSIELLTEFASAVTRVSKLASIMSPVDRFENIRKKERSKSARATMVPIDILIEIVSRGVLSEADPDIDEIEDELVAAACRSALFYFMWKARSLQESISKGDTIADVDIDAIKERLDSFKAGLFSVLSSRGGLDDLRLLATGTLLDVHVLFSTLNPAKKLRTTDAQAAAEANDDGQYVYLQSLVQGITPEVQEELTSIFVSAEKQYAKKAKKALEAPADDDEPEDIDSEPEDEDDEDFTDAERKAEALKAEQKLCELSGKLVLAILAGVIDASGPLKGKLRARIQRNRTKLGPNFKEVVAYLDGPKMKSAAKSHKSKAEQAAAAAKKTMKSAEMVEEDDEEEDDPFAEIDAEPLDEDPPVSVDDDDGNDARGVGEGDEDDIMGD